MGVLLYIKNQATGYHFKSHKNQSGSVSFQWRRHSGLSRRLVGRVSLRGREPEPLSPADVTRLSEEAWLCSAAAEKYDMGMSERERGREWDSPRGINGSSEVWTENLRMGSNDWKHNGKRQTCLYFPLSLSHSHTHSHINTHTATGRSVARLIVNTIGYHCRQVHLPSCEYVPRCIQLQALCEHPFFLLLLLWLFQVEGKRIEATESTSTVWGRDVSELNAVNMDVLLNLYA